MLSYIFLFRYYAKHISTQFCRYDLLYFDFLEEQMLFVVLGNNNGLF